MPFLINGLARAMLDNDQNEQRLKSLTKENIVLTLRGKLRTRLCTELQTTHKTLSGVQ